MRYYFLALIFICMQAQAQWKSFKLTPKGDTINRIDKKGLKQGPWIEHQDNTRGERGYEEEGFYANDKRDGVWKRFSLEGDLLAIENYWQGMKNGKCQYYANSGDVLREESWRAIDPKNPYDTVAVYDLNDPTKILRYQIIKVEPIAYKHGTWTYYTYDLQSGRMSVEKEEWVMNKRKGDEDASTATTAGNDMAPIDPRKNHPPPPPDSVRKKIPKPPTVLEYEKKNSGKKKIKVRDGSTGG